MSCNTTIDISKTTSENCDDLHQRASLATDIDKLAKQHVCNLYIKPNAERKFIQNTCVCPVICIHISKLNIQAKIFLIKGMDGAYVRHTSACGLLARLTTAFTM